VKLLEIQLSPRDESSDSITLARLWNAPVGVVIPKTPFGRGTRISLRWPGTFTLMWRGAVHSWIYRSGTILPRANGVASQPPSAQLSQNHRMPPPKYVSPHPVWGHVFGRTKSNYPA
jgi:hypothetical protein